MEDQATAASSEWLFAAGYSTKYNTLPPSQQLTTRRRNPLTPEQCLVVSPDIEAVLEAVFNAYNNKKLRSKASSATRRATVISNVAAACVQLEPETSAAEPDTGVEVQLEPEGEAQIVCAEPDACDPIAEVAAHAPPEVVQPPVQQPRSRPVPIPRAVATAPKKALPAASGGLAGMLRGRAR